MRWRTLNCARAASSPAAAPRAGASVASALGADSSSIVHYLHGRGERIQKNRPTSETPQDESDWTGKSRAGPDRTARPTSSTSSGRVFASPIGQANQGQAPIGQLADSSANEFDVLRSCVCGAVVGSAQSPAAPALVPPRGAVERPRFGAEELKAPIGQANQKRTSARRGDRFSVADGSANELDVSRSCGLGAVLARAQSPATPGGHSSGAR